MTAATPDSGPDLFSVLTIHNRDTHRTRQEAFVFSLVMQAAVLAVIVYFTSCVIRTQPDLVHRVASLDLPLIFSGHNGGGGGGT